MSNVLSYTLSLQDKITAKLQKIGVSSTNALNKFADLERKTKKVTALMGDMGNSVGALRERLNLLKQERDWIPQKNIKDIRKYNTEIKKLEKEIRKFETINGSKFKRGLKQAVNSLPFSQLITNPVAIAGAALYKGGEMAMKFDEGMAKINTTAQLSQGELSKLKKSLIAMGRDVGADLGTVPDAFEKILSQTGDVALSQDILKASLKGSKAGFTETSVVSAALAQSLSLIGKENANAQEMLDTFFAAKRVGAGEFKDFANYMPNLISSGKALGVTYKQTAGLFSYMTGKGFSAERSAVLMENAYSALGKMDIQKALKKEKINIFDKNGSIRDMGAIFSELSKKMSSMSDEKKSNFLAKIGLKDKEARSAFIVLASDSKKLNNTLKEVSNSAGETDAAYKNSLNPMQKLAKLQSTIQGLMLSLGGVIATVVTPALDLLTAVLNPVVDVFSWFFDGLSQGNPIVLTFAGIMGTLTGLYYAQSIAIKINNLWKKKSIIIDGILAVKANAVAIATKIWTGAQWLLNAAMNANPIGLIVLGIIALISAIVYVVSKIEGWGKAWKHTVTGAKLLWEAFTLSTKSMWTTFTNGIMIGLNKIKEGWYKFKEAVGLGNSSENKAMLLQIQSDTEARKKAIIEGLVKAKQVENAAKNEFLKATDSLSWKNNKITKTSKAVTSGVAPVKNPSINKNGLEGIGTKTNKAIATGGTKHNYITLNVTKEMIGQVIINGKNFKESAKQMQESLTDEMLRTFAMAATAGN